METTPLLRMEHIGKEYFGNRVLSDVSFSLEKGQILGLVGENGAGKSTLMNILFGMPVIGQTGGYEGKILLEGKEVHFADPLDALEAGIGYVHQEFSLIPGFTTTENILLNRESTKKSLLVEVFGERIETLDPSAMRKRADAAIEKLEFALDPQMIVAEMPVGHKQFTEIAREIVRENIKLLVLDEPTAVLGESEAEILLRSVKKLASEGIAVIFISHRLAEVLSTADRVVVLRDGAVVRDADTRSASIPQVAEWMVGRDISETRVSGNGAHRAEAAPPIMTIEHLWVDMPGEIVRDFSIEVREGEILGIGGLAGQGKLGIPNGIMGLYPAGGTVTLAGKPLALGDPRAALQAGMAFVSEDRRGVGLLLDEPLDWNIVFTAMQIQGRYLKTWLGGLLAFRNDKEIAAAAREYIAALDIKCVSERQKAMELSGGNQQKICLAKAFAVRPKLLFVSEPTRGIDVGAKRLVLDTLRKHNEEYGTTIVMVSSELEELRAICHRIAIVDEGRLSGVLPPTAKAADFGLLMVGEGKKGVSQ